MSTRLALTVVGTVVGAYFGYPQLGAVAGAALGSVVDPTTVQGPRINETRQQTAAEGMPRAVIFGTYPCSGNIIQTGPLRIIPTSESQGKGSTKIKGEKGLRTFAIGICEGTGTVLMVKQDNKIVYDMRAGSGMVAESLKWASNKVFYSGAEDQLPDPNLELLDADTPAYRGTMYMVAVDEDVTKMSGAISQYEFLVATAIEPPEVLPMTGSTVIETFTVIEPVRFPVFMNPNGGVGVEVGTVHGNQSVVTHTPYYMVTVDESVTQTATRTISLNGDWTNGGTITPGVGGVQFLGYYGTYALCSDAVSGIGYPRLFLTNNGAMQAMLVPDGSAANDWFSFGSGNQRRLWFTSTHVYLGNPSRKGVNYNNICRWSLGSSAFPTPADAAAGGICLTPGNEFYMHLGRDNKMRVVNDEFRLSTYDLNLTLESSVLLPFSGAGVHGFGVDGDIAVFVHADLGSGGYMDVRRVSDWSLMATYSDTRFNQFNNYGTRVVFTDTGCFVQCGRDVMRFEYSTAFVGEPVVLSDIVDWLHQRTGFPMSKVDTSELTDLVNGLGFASAGYTAADAIDSLRLGYNFDKSIHETTIHYPKRGKPVAKTITINDLTTLPESTRREQTAEIPYRLNARYRDIGSDYATLSQPAGSDSPDRRTTGEVTLDFALALTGDQAARIADIRYKTTLAEVDGQVELPLMLDVALDLAEADCVGYVTPDGQTMRLRIEESEFANWSVKLTTKADRQSAYTSDVTAIPSPPPTLPPSTIVGDTELAIIDGSARTDSEDDISYLAAATGALPPWYGAELQRSLNNGADYYEVLDFETAAIMGVLLEDVSAASPYFTDTTNVLKVQFYRSTASIDSLTEGQFLSRQGVFALENADGSWEYCQGKDVAVQLDESVHITTLHRGIANSGGTAHAAGRRFVWLAGATYVPASSAWLNAALTHRAVSFSESEDDTTNDQTITYVGRSQQEWAPAYLRLARDGSNNITATWVGRGRFGNAFHPVQSRNFTGYRVTITDGVTTTTVDTTSESYSGTWASPVTVSVVAINRITGAGPASTGTV